MPMQSEFFPHEPVPGGLRRKSRHTSTHTTETETEVRADRGADGRIAISEGDVGGLHPARRISLSDAEARVLVDALLGLIESGIA